MIAFLKTLGVKNILFILFVSSLALFFAMQQSKLSSAEGALLTAEGDLVKANKEINKQEKLLNETIEAYENTLILQRSIAKEVAITTEEKEVVSTKKQDLVKAVAKRGEIQVSEEDDFIIIGF